MNTGDIIDRVGHQDLANAIVIMAARDYRNAQKRFKNGDDRALCRIKEVENFFKSKWGDYLCHGKAKEILERLQKEVE